MESETEPASNRSSESMTFLEHLEEMRWVLVRCGGAFLLSAALVAAALPWMSQALMLPLERATEGLDISVAQGLTTTTPLGVLSVMFQLVFLGGLTLSLPAILYFIARFIAPGLNEKELAMLKPACVAAFFLFITGAAFSFFVLMPIALKAMVSFNRAFGFEALWRADSYFGLLVWMTVGAGVSFELPLLLIALMKTGVVTKQQLKDARPYAFVGMLGFSLVATPTQDPITFLIMTLPMCALYEIALLFGAKNAQSP